MQHPVYKLANVQLNTLDQRDYWFIPNNKITLHDEVDLSSMTYEVKNQAQWGTCGPHAEIVWWEALFKRAGMPVKLSIIFPYLKSRLLTGTIPPDVEGVNLRDLLKALARWGCPKDELVPYLLSSFSMDIDTAEILADAATRKLGKYECLFNNTIGPQDPNARAELICNAIEQGLQVLFGAMVTSDIYSMTGPWREQVYRPPGQGSQDVGGHAFRPLGFNRQLRKFKALNSWDDTWGDGGYGGFGFDICGSYGAEAWVTRKVANIYERESPGVKLEMMNYANIRGRIVPTLDQLNMTKKVWYMARNPFAETQDLRWYYKPSLESNSWTLLTPGTVPPHCGEVNFNFDDQANDLYAMRDYMIFNNGIRPYAGFEVYMGYGDFYMSPDFRYEKIVTIPTNI